MAKFCTECGHAITDGMTVCPECGTRLEESAPQTAQEPKTQPVPEKKEPDKTADVCPKCGKPYRPGVQFCTECGTPKANAAQANPVNPAYTAAPAASENAQRTNTVPPAGVPYTPQQTGYPYAAVNEEPRGGVYGVVSTGAFFWLNVLFNLPGLGWLFCIILSFAPQNVNIKHFARSRLIVLLIALILAALAWGIFTIFSSEIAAFFSNILYELFY